MGNFNAVFTGLCAFIPNEDLDDTAKEPSKVMVVMVDARPTDANQSMLAIDSRIVRPHSPFISFNLQDLEGASSLTSKTIFNERGNSIYFLSQKEEDRWQISFEIIKGAANTPLKVVRTGDSDFRHAVKLDDIVDTGLYKLNMKVFDGAGSRGTVSARVLVDKGALSTFLLDKKTEWMLAQTLGGQCKVPKSISNMATLALENVDLVRVLAKNLETADEVFFTFECKGSVRVDIGNICCRSLEPDLSANALAMVDADEDFRWFYYLFEDVDAIETALKGVSLPIPHPVKSYGGAGYKPIQCMRLNWSKVSF